MTCPICRDIGVMRVGYEDGSPQDFGVCLCAAGLKMRGAGYDGRQVGYALWQAWAAREQVDPAHVFMVEEILDDEDLAKIPKPEPLAVGAQHIAAAMQSKKGKL